MSATLDPHPSPEPSGRELTLSEAAAEGWGHASTLRKRVKDGRLRSRQISDRGTYLVFESDLMRQPDLLALRRSRTGWGSSASTGPEPGAADDGLDDLAVMAARMVSTWPRLSPERKRELGRLLAA